MSVATRLFSVSSVVEVLKHVKNAPPTLYQTAKRCFDSSASTEGTELKEENIKQ